MHGTTVMIYVKLYTGGEGADYRTEQTRVPEGVAEKSTAVLVPPTRTTPHPSPPPQPQENNK